MKQIATILFLSFTLISCVNDVEQNIVINSDDIFQYSSKNGLMENDYIGNLTVGEIKENGNFGLGTFNMVDGEMVIFDGDVYQVKTDGSINNMGNQVLSPYVVTKFFDSDTTLSLPNNISLDSLKAILKPLVEGANAPLAIKVNAKFSTLKSRSVDKVASESVGLAEIVANQTEFDFTNVSGTVIGFWYPQYFDGVNFPDYHLHVMLNDFVGGGHLLECNFESAVVEIDFASGVVVAL